MVSRFQLGWITADHVAFAEPEGAERYIIHAVGQPPAPSVLSAVRFLCRSCYADYPNSEAWVSLRDDSGYDADLPDDQRHHVQARSHRPTNSLHTRDRWEMRDSWALLHRCTSDS